MPNPPKYEADKSELKLGPHAKPQRRKDPKVFLLLIRTYLKNRILVQDRGGAELFPLRGIPRLILYGPWVETVGPP